VNPTKAIPFDESAEAAVLGSMIVDPSCIHEVMKQLTRDHFYLPANRAIWDAIMRLLNRGDGLDGLLVRAELQQQGRLDNIGGPDYLQRVLDSVPSSANAAYYARLVIEHHVRRSAIEAGQRIVDGAHDPAVNIIERLKEGREDLDAIDGPVGTAGQKSCVAAPVFVCMGTVAPKPVNWLWSARFPRAMLSLLIGVEGKGKTFVALDMAARITMGRPWPDSTDEFDAPPVGNVVFLTSEDHLEYTVRPRLDAAEADPARVFALKGVKSPEGEAFFDIMEHLPALETMIDQVGDVRLVIVDPLTAFLGSTDQYKNGEVRVALSRFSTLAEKHGCAVIGISHLSKDTSKQAIHRTIGSVAFSAAARAVWLVAQDRDEETRRLFIPVKMNVGRPAKSLAFHIEDMKVQWDAGQFEYDADDVLSASPNQEGAPALANACQWLQGVLANGPVPSSEIWAMARREHIASGTVKRAQAQLRVKPVKSGFGKDAAWHWKLPGEQR
jgi:putative DNA primase/helicase